MVVSSHVTRILLLCCIFSILSLSRVFVPGLAGACWADDTAKQDRRAWRSDIAAG